MNIVLFGFKGAGKTHLGKLLSYHLKLPFIDTDDPITQKYKTPVRELFQDVGGAKFREIEKGIIHEISLLTSHIIALGGGAILDEENQKLPRIRIDINDCIDALPILAVVGCFAKGKTEIYNGAIPRKKESDRISLITQELTKMGAQIEERGDGLVISPSELRGSYLETYKDHRLALSLSVAAIGATGESVITNAECVNKTYRDFYQDFTSIGAKIS